MISPVRLLSVWRALATEIPRAGERRSCRQSRFTKKLTDFFDENLLRHFDFERFRIDHMVRCDREALMAG